MRTWGLCALIINVVFFLVVVAAGKLNHATAVQFLSRRMLLATVMLLFGLLGAGLSSLLSGGSPP